MARRKKKQQNNYYYNNNGIVSYNTYKRQQQREQDAANGIYSFRDYHSKMAQDENDRDQQLRKRIWTMFDNIQKAKAAEPATQAWKEYSQAATNVGSPESAYAAKMMRDTPSTRKDASTQFEAWQKQKEEEERQRQEKKYKQEVAKVRDANTEIWRQIGQDAKDAGAPEAAYAAKMMHDTPGTRKDWQSGYQKWLVDQGLAEDTEAREAEIRRKRRQVGAYNQRMYDEGLRGALGAIKDYNQSVRDGQENERARRQGSLYYQRQYDEALNDYLSNNSTMGRYQREADAMAAEGRKVPGMDDLRKRFEQLYQQPQAQAGKSPVLDQEEIKQKYDLARPKGVQAGQMGQGPVMDRDTIKRNLEKKKGQQMPQGAEAQSAISDEELNKYETVAKMVTGEMDYGKAWQGISEDARRAYDMPFEEFRQVVDELISWGLFDNQEDPAYWSDTKLDAEREMYDQMLNTFDVRTNELENGLESLRGKELFAPLMQEYQSTGLDALRGVILNRSMSAEDMVRTAYDAVVGEGAYDRNTAGMPADAKQALDQVITDTVGYIRMDTDLKSTRELTDQYTKLKDQYDYTAKNRGEIRDQVASADLSGIELENGTVDLNEYRFDRYARRSGTENPADIIHDAISGDLYTDMELAEFDDRNYNIVRMMNEREKEYFESLYRAGKKDEAKAFFEGLEPSLNMYAAVYESMAMQQQARQLPITSFATRSLLTVGQTVEGLRNLPDQIRAAVTGERSDITDPYSKRYAAARMKQELTEALVNDAGDWGMVVSALSSGVDNIINGAMQLGTGIPGLGLALFATQAFDTSLYNNMKEGTGNFGYDVMEAALDAGIETVTEIASMEKLLADPTNLLSWFAKLVISEPSEEIVGEFIEPFVKELTGHRNQYKDRAAQILAQRGYWDDQQKWVDVDERDLDTATRQAMREWVKNMRNAAEEALLSVMPQGVFGATRKAYNTYSVGQTMNQNIPQGAEQIARAAVELRAGEQSTKQAESVLDWVGRNKKPGNYKTGKLLQSVMQDTEASINEKGKKVRKGKIFEALLGRNVAETKAQKLSETIEKALEEGDLNKLTKEEQQEIKENAPAMITLKDFQNDTRTQEDLQEGIREAAEKELNLRQSISSLMTKRAQAAAQFTGRNIAREDDLRAAIGEAVEGPMGAIVYDDGEAKHAKLLGLSDAKNKMGQLQYRVEIGGEEKLVSPEDIRTQNPAMAAIIEQQANNPGFYSQSYTNTMLLEMNQSQQQDKPGDFMAAAAAIRFAAFQGTQMPKVNIPEDAARRLYDSAVQEYDRIRTEETKAENRNAHKAGEGVARFVTADGKTALQYGTKEFDEALEKSGLSREQKKMVRNYSAYSKALGTEVTFVNNAWIREQNRKNGSPFADFEGAEEELYGNESRRGIIINLDGQNKSRNLLTGEIESTGKHNIGVTYGHEFIHFLQRNSREAFDRLSQYVLNEQRKRIGAQALNERLSQYMQQQGLTLEGAISEYLADSCDSIFSNKDVLDHIEQTNKGLYGEIKGFIQDLMDRIKNALRTMRGSMSRAGLDMINGNMRELAKMVNLTWDEAVSTEGTQAQAEAEGISRKSRMVISENGEGGLIKDKYFDRIILNTNYYKGNSFVKIGSITEGGALNQVGIPVNDLRYDYSKINYNLKKHESWLTPAMLAEIPGILQNPIVITEYQSEPNTITVFGEVEKNNQPMTVGIVVTKARNGLLVQPKVRTVNLRSDYENLINDNSVLYLTTNKKKAQNWFQVRGIDVPLGGNQYGLIRRIQLQDENVNSRNSRANVESKEFKNWFRNSKVVDEDGNPMIVYHGTEEDFDAFDPAMSRINMDIQGMFFSPWEIEAGGYGSKIGAYYLSIQNPAPEELAYKTLNKYKGQNEAGRKAREELINKGYDGVKTYDEYIAFYPEQVKSATDNNGNFDRNDKRYRYSRWTEEGMDVNYWMEHVTPSGLQTEDEWQLVQQYRGLKTKMALNTKRQIDYQTKIRQLEAKAELTYEERQELTTLRNNLETRKGEYERLQDELFELTSDKGYANEMYRHNVIFTDFVQGRTYEQVEQSVEQMLKLVEQGKKTIARDTEELKKLAQSQAVQTMKNAMGKTSMKKMAQMLRQENNSTMRISAIEDRLAEMALKQASGMDIDSDTEALARDLVDTMRGIRSEALDYLQGTTLNIGTSLLDAFVSAQNLRSEVTKSKNDTDESIQKKARRLALKYIREYIKGSGVKIIAEGNSRLEEQWSELREKNMGLVDISDMSPQEGLSKVLGFLYNNVQQSIGANQYDIDMDEKSLLVKAAVGNITTYLVDDPAARRQVEGLMKQVADLSRMTERTATDMDELNAQMDEIMLAGQKAKGWTTVLKRDVNDAIKYYNKTAKIAAENERNRVRKSVIENLRSENTKKLIAQQEKFREQMANDRQARELAQDNLALRSKISTVASRMANRIFSETDQKNVPEEAKPLVRQVLQMLGMHDMAFRRVTNWNGKQIEDILKRLTRMNEASGEFDAEADLNWLVYGEGENRDTDARDRIMNDLMAIEMGLLDYRRSEGQGRISLQDRKAALERVQEAMSEIWNAVQSRSQAEINGRKWQVFELAEMMNEDMDRSTFKGDRTGFGSRARDAVSGAVNWGNLTPEYFFKNLKNKAMNILHGGLHEAENRSGLEAMRARTRLAQIAQETNFASWDGQEEHKVQTRSGEVTMTTEQVMALYATWIREQNQLRPEETAHLLHGGFVLAQKENTKGKPGRQRSEARPIRMSEGQLNKLADLLTEDQLKYLHAVVNYMSTELAELGNEASMKMYGIKKFTERFYFPIKSWGGVLNSRSDAGVTNNFENRATQQGFSKRIINHARNAIEIGDFTPTAMKHVSGMITYNTVGPAIENMNKVLNQRLTFGEVTYNESDEAMDDTWEQNMRAKFREVYGKQASDYLATFMKDMNGGVSMERTPFDKLLSLFKKNAVAGSLSVAAQQPLSYIRAAMLIDSRYLAQAISPVYWKGSYKEMMEHSGIAVIKEMGKFDMNYGQTMTEWITPEGMKTKGQQVKEGAMNALTGLPQKMDAMTWTRMWTAVKLEQMAQNKGADYTSDEFLNKVGERFNELMRQTQVYDSTMVKSQNMRSKHFYAKTLTSFMAEPTLSLNVLADAWQNRKEQGGKRKIARALATFMLSAAAQAGAKAFFGTGRSPKKEKNREENFLNKYVQNIISEANPLSLIPGYSDLIEVLTQGELKDDTMGMIGKAAEVFDNVISLATGKTEGTYRNLEDSIGQMVQLGTNIPLKNIMRDFRAMVNFFSNGNAQSFTGDTYAQRETSTAMLKYQTIDMFLSQDLIGMLNKRLDYALYNTSTTEYYKRIYEAQKSGDQTAVEQMKEYVILNSKAQDPEKNLNDKLKDMAKKDSTISEEERTDYVIATSTEKSGGDYVIAQVKAGKISADDARKKMKEIDPDADEEKIWWRVDRAEYEAQTGIKLSSNDTYYRLKDAIAGNKSDTIRDTISMLMKHGVTKEKIKGKLSDWKSEYLNATGAGKTKLFDALTKAYKAIGLTPDEAKKIINGWKPKEKK